MQNGTRVHNGFVVPYNKLLCSRFNAHINVEYCGWNMMIKYLFKYISKGVERVAFYLQKAESSVSEASTSSNALNTDAVSGGVETVDEIEQFVHGRFVCPHEAAWRLLNFVIHERQPAVIILQVHLEKMQMVTFRDNCHLEQLVDDTSFDNSTLSRWLIANRWDPDGRKLTYVEYPSQFTWNVGRKDWFYRTRNSVPAVGRLVYVHPTAGELFYLRMLLCHQRGCRSFREIRTVREVVYSSYQLACEAMGLIGDDKEWLTAFNQASLWASSSELRSLFCNLLLYCEVGNPAVLWSHAWYKMDDDISRILSDSTLSSQLIVAEVMLQQHILLELEKLLNSSTPPKSLASFNLPLPSSDLLQSLTNRLLLEETLYDKLCLAYQHLQMCQKLNPEQLQIYNRLRNDEILRKTLLFVYGHGGTGKTFLWSAILAHFRSTGKVALAVASSGIASFLLPNGRTAHSRFNIPINPVNTSVCNIKKKTQLCELRQQTRVIIWDEATMMDRECFECVDRTFRDVLETKDKPFGGVSVLLGGEFRQTLPIKPKKSHRDVILATIPNSHLWPAFTLYKLCYNMRLSSAHSENSTNADSARFAQWLLDVGNGTVGTPDKANPRHVSDIEIPEDYLITDNNYGLQQLIDFVYGASILIHPTPEILCNRAIVCPKNSTVDEINSKILHSIPGTPTTYYSSDR